MKSPSSLEKKSTLSFIILDGGIAHILHTYTKMESIARVEIQPNGVDKIPSQACQITIILHVT